MLLKEFNDNQKINFWKLANILVKADGKMEDSEKNMLDEYKDELGIGEYEYYEGTESLESIINDMNLDIRLKKILMFELLGLAFADDYFDQEEKELLVKIQALIELNDETVKKLGKMVNELFDLYSRIGDEING